MKFEMKKFKKVALGGTFDRLHLGHRKLLSAAIEVAENLVIGLTSDSFVVDKKLSKLILPYEERKNELEQVLFSGEFGKFEVHELNDVFGTTLKDPKIEALVVSEQTRVGARQVNAARKKLQLYKLPVVVAKMVEDEEGNYLSSTRIRLGKVSRSGVVYHKVLMNTLKLNDGQLRQLKKPAGCMFSNTKIVEAINSDKNIVLVGDQVLMNAIEQGVDWNYAIFDRKIGREKHNSEYGFDKYGVIKGSNASGRITHEASDAIRKMLSNDRGVVEIDGEEDLMVLPVILLSKLNSQIIYGQPNKGFVVIDVDESCKDKWYGFLSGK